MERLQKYLAAAGVCSRRTAEAWIEAGRVEVNGHVVRERGTRVDPARDTVRVDGKRVAARAGPPFYLMLNKPRGYVTTLADPQGRPTVADLLHDAPVRVFPVGRLDFHSEGLLLVTNDGALARDLMHPSRAVPKTYAVKVRGRPDGAALARLARGIRLDGRMARATEVRLIAAGANSRLELTVVEGRKHLVRRLCAAVGHPVLRLCRTRYGPLRLGRLAAGRWRLLSAGELARLKNAPRGGRARGSRSDVIR